MTHTGQKLLYNCYWSFSTTTQKMSFNKLKLFDVYLWCYNSFLNIKIEWTFAFKTLIVGPKSDRVLFFCATEYITLNKKTVTVSASWRLLVILGLPIQHFDPRIYAINDLLCLLSSLVYKLFTGSYFMWELLDYWMKF